MVLCVSCANGVCFCTGQFHMVPLNLTLSSLSATFILCTSIQITLYVIRIMETQINCLLALYGLLDQRCYFIHSFHKVVS